MEDSSEKQEEKVEMEDNCTLESRNENGLSVEKSVIDTESSNRINEQPEVDQNEKNVADPQIIDENLNSSKSKETGTKAKRKVRSTRRKLNAMINNSSLHFSDTDSEGELTTINSQIKPLNNIEQNPIISVTFDVIENESSNYLSLDDKDFVKRNNFVENMTDVDEIYPSELENEENENQDNLKIVDTPFQTETDLEDLEGEDEVQSPIYVKPRSDIFCDYSGETITTKEGEGPFSVEVRNKIYEDSPQNETCGATPDIVVMSNTDEEDMVVSGDEEEQETCCSQKELFEDLDVLVASQVIMKNINKMENLLTVKEISDDGTSDCHTDVEEVE
ncbi:uncharacterized protein LOC122719943 [Apis laboriosa]|uniref:uncharacterized protein LOC122719943 n=1 Tax=Apis laboriosa TaxID=183418 RepID=UPI001CC4F4A3|nr:uncharacterized protein LOC122719943 [Apis laboriosa]XP_043802163.1 uncharacterized protein LOC122719943 [Apis laboriosa]